jgi:hypothetical protein
MAELIAYAILGGVIVLTALILWGFVRLVAWTEAEF